MPREKICCFPGCNGITTTRFCERHKKSPMYRASRESKQFLNSALWLALRALKLRLTPWCEVCEKTKPIPVPATQVDHIKPRHTHPELKADIKNLQSICDECHGVKTRSEYA